MAEEISKASVEGALLAAYDKMLEERDRLREELLSKKGLGFDDLEALSLSRSEKMLKLGNSLLEKCTLGREPRLWLYKLLQKR